MIITIQLSAKNKIFSRLIRWGTRGRFDHVDIVMPDRSLVGAHLFGGIQKTVFYKKKFSKIKRYEIEVPAGTVDWIYAQQGRKYDLLAILGFIFKIPIKESTASICSSFVFDVLEMSEPFTHFVKFKSTEISPRDLHLVLQVLEATGCAKLV